MPLVRSDLGHRSSKSYWYGEGQSALISSFLSEIRVESLFQVQLVIRQMRRLYVFSDQGINYNRLR